MNFCRYGVAVLCVLLLGAVGLAQAGKETFSDELDTDLYDVSLTVKAAPQLTANAMVRLALEASGDKEAVRLSIAPRAIFLVGVHEGHQQPLGQAKITVKPGATTHFTIQRRGDALSILQGDTRVYRGKAPRGKGAEGRIAADAGWTVDEVRVQRLEPVAFADDFMRTKDENGGWTVQSGQWKLSSAWDSEPHGNRERFTMALTAQNPFAWRGKADSTPALCVTGKPLWEDYTMTAAVRPEASGAVGVAVNLLDNANGLLVRWSSASDRGQRGDRLTVEKLVNGKTSVLAEERGGFIPGQWYRLAVVSELGGIRVLVDNNERLALNDVTPWHGGVGLYTESRDGATFDDITVYGRTLKTDLMEESSSTRIQERFLNDGQGMRSWANPSDFYTAENGVNINQHDYFSEQWMVLSVRLNTPDGKLVLVLHGNGQDDSAGLRAIITADRVPQQMRYQLFHDDIELAKASGPVFDAREDTTVRFRAAAGALTLEVDGKPVLQAADSRPAPGLRPAYRADGAFRNLRNLLVLGRNYRDFIFTGAPVDWVGEGTWMATVRWACQPQWSFYSGWSRGDAVLWHKQRLLGDQSLQVYMGYKMEVPREREIYESIYHSHDACISICTDGHDPRSGYAIMSGQRNEYNRPSSETVLLRNGVPVQRVNTSVFGWGWSHRAWFDMELRKRGDTVELWLDSQLAMSYRDPHPLEGGVPAIWTSDGGLSIARVRLSYANPPQPRTDVQVALDTPWIPEFTNVRKPLTLDFPNAWSATGKPVTLHVIARLAPDGATPPAVKDKHIIFTPSKGGEYWYQVTAGDGKATSMAFNLSGTAFDPSLGRDDSHALVLYRFDEGTGAVVHDRAPNGPPADLQAPDFPNTTWLPGQGLSFSGPNPLKTAGGVAKLMAIARSKACTLEVWTSNDTEYFPQHWLGCLLTWESGAGKQNFLLGGHKADLIAAPSGGQFETGYNDNYVNTNGSYNAYFGFRTSLHHTVITWDGTNTRGYNDGKPLEAQQINWHPDQWTADAPLLLGNRTDNQRTYLGTFYLVAIHDKCLSADEVKRHYLAGPSAK